MQIDRQPEHGIAGRFNFTPQRVIGREVAALDALVKPSQVSVGASASCRYRRRR
jgi:hypothetical protein